MFCTILVTELPPSSVKLIWSPIFNSVVNLVPEPTNISAWSAGFSKPIAFTKSPVYEIHIVLQNPKGTGARFSIPESC